MYWPLFWMLGTGQRRKKTQLAGTVERTSQGGRQLQGNSALRGHQALEPVPRGKRQGRAKAKAGQTARDTGPDGEKVPGARVQRTGAGETESWASTVNRQLRRTNPNGQKKKHTFTSSQENKCKLKLH